MQPARMADSGRLQSRPCAVSPSDPRSFPCFDLSEWYTTSTAFAWVICSGAVSVTLADLWSSAEKEFLVLLPSSGVNLKRLLIKVGFE